MLSIFILNYLLAKSTLSKEAMEKLKEAWRKLYSNDYDTKDNAVVLNEGVDFKESSATSVELQLNENKQTNAAEICKLFCMPMEILNGKATETVISQFVQNCLMPPINAIEAALDHDLLTESEKAGHYYFAFDTSELTRGDFVSRMNGYAMALQNNIYQLDEIREREDLPPLNFNYIRLGLDSVLLDPKTREIYTPNTGKLEKMNAEHLTEEQIRAILESRGRHYIKGEHGYFMGSYSDGMSSGGSGGGVSGGVPGNGSDQPEIGAILKGAYNPSDIAKAISQEGTNFVIKDINNPESLYGEMVEKIPPEKDFYDIKAHGASDSVKIFNSVVDSKELARIITLRKDYHGENIRLLCCDTGKMMNGTCVAKELANLLGVKVKAPTELIFASNDGSYKIMSEDYSRIGKMEVFRND